MSESGNQHTDGQAPITPNQQAYDLPMFDNKRLFSLHAHNEMVKRVNALTRMRPQRGAADGDLIISDSNAILPLTNEAGSGSGSGSGNMNWRGLYSAATDYSQFDVVYTQNLLGIGERITWIANTANGPSTTIVSPAWPEPGSPTWTALDFFTTGFVRYTLANAPSNAGNNPQGAISLGKGDYVYGAPSAGGSNAYILKPPLLRFSVTTRTLIGGTTITYSSYSDSGQTRSATDGVSTVTQYITSQYVTGDEIDVTVNDLGTLCDVNTDGRVFAGI